MDAKSLWKLENWRSKRMAQSSCVWAIRCCSLQSFRQKKPEKAGLEKLFYRRYPEFAKALRNRPWVYNRQLEEIEALKEEGKIFLIRPSEPLSISRTSKDPVEIAAVYQIGMEDGKRQLPALFEWLRG